MIGDGDGNMVIMVIVFKSSSSPRRTTLSHSHRKTCFASIAHWRQHRRGGCRECVLTKTTARGASRTSRRPTVGMLGAHALFLGAAASSVSRNTVILRSV
eukprot:101053-Prymnesium_polylepis.2